MLTLGRVASMLALTLASPAAAQAPTFGDQFLLDDLRARQQATERRAIDQANQIMALEARLQADRAVLDLRQQSISSTSQATSVVRPAESAIKYPSVPDAALADSNRRVREAADNRH